MLLNKNKNRPQEKSGTIQDMTLRAWYSRRELMLTIVTAVGIWDMVVA